MQNPFLSPWWSLAVGGDASNKALGLSGTVCNMHHMHTYLGPFKRPCSLPGGLWRTSLFLSFPLKFHVCSTPRRVVHNAWISMKDAAYILLLTMHDDYVIVVEEIDGNLALPGIAFTLTSAVCFIAS